MNQLCIAFLFGVLLACGPAPEPEKAEAPAPAPPPRNESHRFPPEGLVSTSIAEDHILGKEFLPPGNVAEYSRDGKTFSMFLFTTPTEERAGLLAFDIKGRFADPAFVADFGGFFGTLDGQPWFIFPKKKAVAGVVGLPRDQAHEAARFLAGRME